MNIYNVIYDRLNSFANIQTGTRQENYSIVYFLIETTNIFSSKIQNAEQFEKQTKIIDIQTQNIGQPDLDFAKRFNNLCENFLNKEVGRNLIELKMMIMFNENNEEITKKLKELCKKLAFITKTML